MISPMSRAKFMGTISFAHRHEFQAQVTTGIFMSHYPVPDLSLLNQKFNLGITVITANARDFSKLREFRTFAWRVNNPRTS
jgi:hypothetical protein